MEYLHSYLGIASPIHILINSHVFVPKMMPGFRHDIPTINHSYWSYVHQLSYRTGAPLCRQIGKVSNKHDNVLNMIHGGWSKFRDLQTATLREKKILLRISRDPHVYFSRGSHVKIVREIFRPQKNVFANSEKKQLWQGLMLNPGDLCNGQSLHGPLDRQLHVYIIYLINISIYILYYIIY